MLFYRKVKVSQLTDNTTVLIPVNHFSQKRHDRLSYDEYIVVKMRQNRNYKHLCKYFCILQLAIDQGILENDIVSEDVVINYIHIVAMLLENNNDYIDTLHTIMKYLFLPKKIITLPGGEKILDISSISFEKMKDQHEFNEFYDKSIEFIADFLKIDRYKLESEANDNDS